MKLLNTANASVSETGDYTWTYIGNESPNGIEFSNDSTGDATITVGRWTFTVKSGEVFETYVPESFTQIDVVITGDFRMLVGS